MEQEQEQEEKREKINFPLTKSDFEKWGELIEEREKEIEEEIKMDKCPICDSNLETYEKGHWLFNIVFICFNCELVFEKEDGKLVKGKRSEVI